MTHIKYSLEIYDSKGEQLSNLHDLDSLPRFQVGDEFDLYFFDPLCDPGDRAIVSDACYFHGGDAKQPTLSLHIRIHDEPLNAKDKRRERQQIGR
jgi:hypothetical protein